MFDARELPPFPERILTTLKAPGEDDATDLEIGGEALKCASAGKEFPFIKGVPSLYMPPEGQSEEITNRVRSFYESNPFPSYEGMEEFAELVNKGSENPFSADLLKAIGYNKIILECGCGTGQLSHVRRSVHRIYCAHPAQGASVHGHRRRSDIDLRHKRIFGLHVHHPTAGAGRR